MYIQKINVVMMEIKPLSIKDSNTILQTKINEPDDLNELSKSNENLLT